MSPRDLAAPRDTGRHAASVGRPAASAARPAASAGRHAASAGRHQAPVRRSAPTPAQLSLKLVALCLHYPGPEYRRVLAAVEAELERLPSLPGTVRRELKTFCAAVRQLPVETWASRYVSTFDFQKEHALYLCYHEHGESIKRSSAMVALKRQIARAGFVCPEDEMPDYIPLLLEYLAERPRSAPAGSLPERLSRVLSAIVTSLGQSDSLYVPVLRAALAVLPAATPGGAAPGDGASSPWDGAPCAAPPCAAAPRSGPPGAAAPRFGPPWAAAPQSAFETGVIQ